MSDEHEPRTPLGNAVFLAIKDGKLKAKKAGRRTLVLREELRRFLDINKKPSRRLYFVARHQAE